MPSEGQDIFTEYFESPTNFGCVQQAALEETEQSLALHTARVPGGAMLWAGLANQPQELGTPSQVHHRAYEANTQTVLRKA